LPENQRDFEKRFVFTGTSCFPLTPCAEMANSGEEGVNIISKRDQMIKIIDGLGRMSEDDMSFVTEKPALDYLISIQPKK